MGSKFTYKIVKKIVGKTLISQAVEVEMIIAAPNEKEAELIAVKRISKVATKNLRFRNYKAIDISSTRLSESGLIKITFKA